MKNILPDSFKKSLLSAILLCFTTIVYGQCPNLPVSLIDGTNGFVIEGISEDDQLGYSVSDAGDINADGIPDMIIGAYLVDDGSLADVGKAYVVFGSSGFSSADFDVTLLDGSNGFVVKGTAANDHVGISVSSAGDFNGDGLDDIIIGMPGHEDKGAAMVLYGNRSGFSATITPSEIANTKGIIIKGQHANTAFGDQVSGAGDVNGDGYSDVVINEPRYSEGGLSQLGQTYVVFGGSSVSTGFEVSDIDGTNGFSFKGVYQYDGSYNVIGMAGDVNADGFDDILLGTPSADDNRGKGYVIFGKSTGFSGSLDLKTLNGTNGFLMNGLNPSDRFGTSVAHAGDYNADGFDDIIISASAAESKGEVYMIFGRNSGFSAVVDVSLLNGSNGFTIIGSSDYMGLGKSISSAGDFNNDGIDDILLGADKTFQHRWPSNKAAYVLFGGSGTRNKEFLIENINGINGMAYYLEQSSVIDFAKSLSNLGDVNADGVDDIIIGSTSSYTQFYNMNGTGYVIFGGTMDNTDEEAPVISCPSNQGLLAGSSLPNYVSLVSARDNCANPYDLSYTQTPARGTLFTGPVTVTITVSDRSNNVSSCSFVVNESAPLSPPDCKTITIKAGDQRILGSHAGAVTGHSVNTAGDFNGDGIDDYIIGAPGSSHSNVQEYIEGEVYLIYGKSSGYAPNLDLKFLKESEGFKIINDTYYSSQPNTGYTVSTAGDVNGDGFDDIMLSDPYRKTSLGPEIGYTYVIFGKAGVIPSPFKLSELDGNNGFTILGLQGWDNAGITLSSAGDINHDGFDDILLGTAPGGSDVSAKCYVVFGKASGFPPLFEVGELNGTNGFIISPETEGDKLGTSVSGLGDFNGDGIDDIAIGSANGEAYIIFGNSSGFAADFNLVNLDGTNGFRLVSKDVPVNRFGSEIANIGDINGDGLNDFVVGSNSSISYVLFGTSTAFPPVFDVAGLDGTNGFYNQTGSSSLFASTPGDFNNDGYDDLFQGSFLLFGKGSGWSDTVKINQLKAGDYLKLFDNVYYEKDISFVGDINNDGMSDILVGISGSRYQNKVFYNNPGHVELLFGFSIKDTEAPSITCPGDQTLIAGEALPDYTTELTATDNCDADLEITQNPVAGSAFTSGMQVTLEAKDGAGNISSCTFEVHGTADTEKPEINCPANQTLACDATEIPDFTAMVSATDNRDQEVTITQLPNAGTVLTDGMTITMTAEDAAGNSNTCTFTVSRAADTEKPTITFCPGDQILEPGEVLSDYTTALTATDNCDGDLEITQSPVAGTAFTAGMQVTVTVKDGAGNISTCTFKVHETADTEKPEITCPANQTLACDVTEIPDFTALVSATDNQDYNPVITQVPAVGTVFADGMTITMTAEDAAGNSNTCTFTLSKAADTEKPSITFCPGDQILEPGEALPDYTTALTATDNCYGDLEITQSPAAGTAVTAGMTVTLTVTDAGGNSSSCTFAVMEEEHEEVPDTEAPVISCPGDQELGCGTTILQDFRTMVTATDNKDVDLFISQYPAAGEVFTEGMTITITAEDVARNSSTCSFTVAETAQPEVDAGMDASIVVGEEHQLEAVASSPGTFSWEPAAGLDNAYIADPVASPEKTTTYTVTFTTEGGCSTEDAVTLEVLDIFIPKGFSPDNDGINDNWIIRGIENYTENEVFIFNRWGDRVFSVKGYDNSRTVFTGQANRLVQLGAGELPEGTYFYTIVLSEGEKPVKGFLVLKK